jgi:hypothetical protein
MPTIYVAKSMSLQKWGAEVGLTKHLYKVGVAQDSAEAAIEELNATDHGGRHDWRLIRKEEVDGVEEEAAYTRLSRRVTRVDPDYYPKIKGARGIFKISVSGIEQQLLVQRALAGEIKAITIKQADVAAYLIRNAAGEALAESADPEHASRFR